MLPNYFLDLISARARDEREAEEKREMRVEALPDWLEIYQKGGAAVFRLLRSIFPDRMIPSLYQLDHFKETLALEYGPTISWRRTYQIKAAEFLPSSFSRISCDTFQGTTRGFSTTSGSF